MKLTSADHALPPGKADAILFDDELIGFGLRLRRGSGGKLIRNWVVQYRAHGRSRRIVVGAVEKVSAAEARQQARKLLAAVALGGDPQAEKAARRDRDVLSFRRVAEDFIAVKTGIKPRSLGLLRLYLVGGPYLKPLHPVPIDKVTRKDIAARLLAVAKASGAPTSVQVHSAVSNLMTWAMQMGFIEANPIVGAFKPKRAPGRERVLTDDELKKVWEGVGDGEYAKIIRLLILTGARAQGGRKSTLTAEHGRCPPSAARTAARIRCRSPA